jgi:tRNA-splicing endonuclease subunit Sen34
MTESVITEPFPIFSVCGRYLLFDVNVISHVRRQHHFCGVLIGNIPQANQQNIFSGLPLELLPEEARLLVLHRHAFVVDDVSAHENQIGSLSLEARQNFVTSLEKRGLAAAAAAKDAAQQRKIKALEKMQKKRQGKPEVHPSQSKIGDDSLFESSGHSENSQIPQSTSILQPLLVTPTTSYPPLDSSRYIDSGVIPAATPSFDLFAHLHSKGYFLSPGLRFGCEFMAYPGDPLRFHSHFLVVSKEWDEPIDLMDIVSGGRLGTGVKKSYMIGGVDPRENDNKKDKNDTQGEVRTFCFEWAAM